MSAEESARPDVVAGLRLLRVVGRGGEGEVWEAVDPYGERRAAKLIRPDGLASPAIVAERSAYLERIDHPALVRVERSGVLDSGALAGWGFVEMEFVDGRTLDGAEASWEWLDRLVTLAEGLDLLHHGTWSEGVPLVHRDVKPANIVESPDGRLVLVDLSTLRGADSAVMTRIGTPVFAAPEVLTGRVGPPADVYSLAVTVVALVTGARGGDLAAIVGDPAGLDLPDGVRAGLSLEPRDRPVSCQAMLLDDDPPALRDFDDEDRWGDTWLLGSGSFAEAPARELLWPWLGGLAAVTAPPVYGWLIGAARAELVWLGALALVLHLCLALVGRQPLVTALLAPPLAWGFLLGHRSVHPLAYVSSARVQRRRTWTAAAVTGGLLAAIAGVLLVTGFGELVEGLPDGLPGPALVAAGLVSAFAAPYAMGAAGLGGLLLRLLLAPAWVVGAVVLVGGVALLPLALLAGRGAALLRRAGAAVLSLAEFFSGPPRPA